MTARQFIIKHIYPILLRFIKSKKRDVVISNDKNVSPVASFYELKANPFQGDELDFKSFKNKKILLVNTASDCGFTPQFEALQKLHEQYKEQLVVLGFPANDFKEQEKNGDAEIVTFCQVNYGVTFTIMKKSMVIKNDNQNPVYKWLTNSSLNGWNNHQPDWNFSKYLVDEQGVLTHYFGSSVNPTGSELIAAITVKNC